MTEHWHLTDGAVLAPHARHSFEPLGASGLSGRFTLTLCTSPVLTAPGRPWHGLCEAKAGPFGWSPGIEGRLYELRQALLSHTPAADMNDAAYLAHMEWNYRRSTYKGSLLEFMGMTPGEYAAWIMYGEVPERVMRVAGRR